MRALILIGALLLTGCATDVAQVIGGPLGYETREHAVARMSEGPALRPAAQQVYVRPDAPPAYVGPRVTSFKCSEANNDARRLACLYDAAGIEASVWY